MQASLRYDYFNTKDKNINEPLDLVFNAETESMCINIIVLQSIPGFLDSLDQMFHVHFLQKLKKVPLIHFTCSSDRYRILTQKDAFTFGVERDEAVAQRPVLHRLLQDHLLGKDDHIDVVKLTKSVQDLSHGLGCGLLHHGTYANHDLSLWRLQKGSNWRWWYNAKHVMQRNKKRLNCNVLLDSFTTVLPLTLWTLGSCIYRYNITFNYL